MKSDLTLRLDRGFPLTFEQHDANIDRLMYWSNIWEAGIYTPEEIVFHVGGLWRCRTQTTKEPRTDNPDWSLLTPNPGMGAVDLSTPTVISIGTGWVTLPFDTEFHPAYLTTWDYANNTYALDGPGIWEITAYYNISHNEANTSRGFDIRLYNVSEASGGPAVRQYVGRNIYGTANTLVFRQLVTYDEVYDAFRLEIGNADGTFSSETLQNFSLDIKQITPRVYLPTVIPGFTDDYTFVVGATLQGGWGHQLGYTAGGLDPETLGDPALGQTQATVTYLGSSTNDGLTDGFKIQCSTDPGILRDLQVTIPGFGAATITRQSAGLWYAEWPGVGAYMQSENGNQMTLTVAEAT